MGWSKLMCKVICATCWVSNKKGQCFEHWKKVRRPLTNINNLRKMDVTFDHVWWFLKIVFLLMYLKSFCVIKNRPSRHNHNKLYSKIKFTQQNFKKTKKKRCVWNCFWCWMPGCLFWDVFQVLSKGFCLIQWKAFQGVQKRGNPTMTSSKVTARRKGDPQHYVEGQTRPHKVKNKSGK